MIIDLAMIAIFLMVYFIPSFVAFNRKHSYKLGILLLNIFLGWTLVGWVAALVWCFVDGNKNHGGEALQKDDRYTQMEKLAKLKESGALSDEEFQVEKKRLLK